MTSWRICIFPRRSQVAADRRCPIDSPCKSFACRESTDLTTDLTSRRLDFPPTWAVGRIGAAIEGPPDPILRSGSRGIADIRNRCVRLAAFRRYGEKIEIYRMDGCMDSTGRQSCRQRWQVSLGGVRELVKLEDTQKPRIKVRLIYVIQLVIHFSMDP